MKYKQTVIPTVIIPTEWKKLKGIELRKFIFEYIKQHYAGQVVKNIDTSINVHISITGGRKTAYGEAIYSKKAVLMFVLPDIIKYAKRNNFGEPKAKDGANILGYLNFKCKCKIDNKIENVRLAIQIQKGGKFYYNIEVNKKTII